MVNKNVVIKVYNNKNQVIENFEFNVPPDRDIPRGRRDEFPVGTKHTNLNEVYAPLVEFDTFNKTATRLWK